MNMSKKNMHITPEDRILNSFGELQRKQFSAIPGEKDEIFRAALILSKEGYILFSQNDEQGRPILIDITEAGRILVLEGGYAKHHKQEKIKIILNKVFDSIKDLVSVFKFL